MNPDLDSLRYEIAAAAARMIAEDGADYGSAKRKAAQQILGGARTPGDVMPDNAMVEDEVRTYQELFMGETQPARLAQLRELALRLMTDLQEFTPYLTGAVLNGTAGEHSDIHLQLFTDSPKDVEIWLLNKNVQFEVSESANFRGPNFDPVETASFLFRGEGVHLALYHTDDLRGARKSASGRSERADLEAVRRMVEAGAA